MDWSVTYIASQIATIIMYGLLALSYYAKDRKKVLIISFLSVVVNAIAYILLSAWSGVAMCLIAIVRNILFLVDEKKNGVKEKVDKKDIVILIILYLISIVSAIFTYEGFLSLLSVFATMLYTFSVWQKKTNIYKLLGIPIGILWIAYNFYIMSIFGVILESILLICSMTGYWLEIRNDKKSKEK